MRRCTACFGVGEHFSGRLLLSCIVCAGIGLIPDAPHATDTPPPETKPDVALVPAKGVLAVAALMTAAQAKYKEAKWPSISVGQHVSACLRHVYKHLSGDKTDAEFGFPHLVHAAARMLMAVAQLGVLDTK